MKGKSKLSPLNEKSFIFLEKEWLFIKSKKFVRHSFSSDKESQKNCIKVTETESLLLEVVILVGLTELL